MREVILISGSGRSGTSIIAKSLQGLGYHIPGVQVAPDETNPSGFGEPQWLVEFHNAQLHKLGLNNSDARPEILQTTFGHSFDEQSIAEASERFMEQLSASNWNETSPIVLKDPRIIYFLPLWANVLQGLSFNISHILASRNPLEVVASKSKWYSNGMTEVYRYCGWINGMLLSELYSRPYPRAVIRHSDLIDDWVATLAKGVEELNLPLVVGTGPLADLIDEGRKHSSSENFNAEALQSLQRFNFEEIGSALDSHLNTESHAPGSISFDTFDALRERYEATYSELISYAHNHQEPGLKSLLRPYTVSRNKLSSELKEKDRRIRRLEEQNRRLHDNYIALKKYKNRLEKSKRKSADDYQTLKTKTKAIEKDLERTRSELSRLNASRSVRAVIAARTVCVRAIRKVKGLFDA